MQKYVVIYAESTYFCVESYTKRNDAINNVQIEKRGSVYYQVSITKKPEKQTAHKQSLTTR